MPQLQLLGQPETTCNQSCHCHNGSYVHAPVFDSAHGLQLSILDGNLYDSWCQEAGQELDSNQLEAALLLLNNRQHPLLAVEGGGQHSSTGTVLVQLSVCPELATCMIQFAWPECCTPAGR